MQVDIEKGIISGRSIDLRLVVESDAAFILSLRTDDSRNRFLSSVSADLNAQQTWIRNYKEREHRRLEYYFIIQSKQGEPYGAVRMYDFQGDSFSWGSWVLKPGSPVYVALESALLIYCFAYYELMFKRSHFDVRKGNAAVNRFHKSWGAAVISEDELNYYYEYDEQRFSVIKKKYESRL